MHRWKKHFCQLLSVLGINNVTRSEARTFGPLVLQIRDFEFEIDIEVLKNYHILIKFRQKGYTQETRENALRSITF